MASFAVMVLLLILLQEIPAKATFSSFPKRPLVLDSVPHLGELELPVPVLELELVAMQEVLVAMQKMLVPVLLHLLVVLR